MLGELAGGLAISKLNFEYNKTRKAYKTRQETYCQKSSFENRVISDIVRE